MVTRVPEMMHQWIGQRGTRTWIRRAVSPASPGKKNGTRRPCSSALSTEGVEVRIENGQTLLPPMSILTAAIRTTSLLQRIENTKMLLMAQMTVLMADHKTMSIVLGRKGARGDRRQGAQIML